MKTIEQKIIDNLYEQNLDLRQRLDYVINYLCDFYPRLDEENIRELVEIARGNLKYEIGDSNE